MSISSPVPVIFEPLFKPKPWGGRMLERLLGKKLPPGDLIGESWEVVSLPDNESRVARGPQAGRTLTQLVQEWGAGLTGRAPLADGRFPLMIKFLDAREHLSVQVHPKPASDDPTGWQPGIKHEAWYVLHADPGAELYIGLRPGVSAADLRAAANTAGMAGLLRSWPARAGQCYYLPSGTLHALGAGVVVAEVQTPSDVTYRIYDWGRTGDDGQPRTLHIAQALANIRQDVAESEIVRPRSQTAGHFAGATRVAACARFAIDKVQLSGGLARPLNSVEMVIWMVLSGGGRLIRDTLVCEFATGETVLIPADSRGTRVEVASDTELLEVTIPVAGAVTRTT